jgi:glycosyltransferase involved in cell wall biosynthesis
MMAHSTRVPPALPADRSLRVAGTIGQVAGLRVAHLIESDGPGGAERVVVHMATTLQAAGAHNVVFLPADGEGWLARELEGSGVVVEHFHIERPLSPPCARELAQAFRRHRIDVAHSHEFSMAVYGAWASWRAGVPHVITMHGSRYYAGRLQRRLAMRAAMAASSRTVAVSDSLARAIGHDLWVRRSHVSVMPNGVRYTAPERVTLRDELQLAPDARVLVAVGNLYPVKGHTHLIDAAARLAERHPTLHVAIAGRGDLAATLWSRARTRGLDGRVHLLGLRDDISAILAAADVFVMPSLSEGLPLALLEAMWAGRPIVASDVGEVGVALNHGEAGALVEPGNVEALAEALDRVLSDREHAQRLADHAARRACAEYDITRMVGRYVELYAQAMGGVSACHANDSLMTSRAR